MVVLAVTLSSTCFLAQAAVVDEVGKKEIRGVEATRSRRGPRRRSVTVGLSAGGVAGGRGGGVGVDKLDLRRRGTDVGECVPLLMAFKRGFAWGFPVA